MDNGPFSSTIYVLQMVQYIFQMVMFHTPGEVAGRTVELQTPIPTIRIIQVRSILYASIIFILKFL